MTEKLIHRIFADIAIGVQLPEYVLCYSVKKLLIHNPPTQRHYRTLNTAEKLTAITVLIFDIIIDINIEQVTNEIKLRGYC